MNKVFSSLLDGPDRGETAFFEWLDKRNRANEFRVQQMPLDNLNKWYFERDSGNLRHESGKFFSIEGVRVKTNFGTLGGWDQVIINQPEVGILGIITKVQNGQRYFLMQAKMEPGNINILQISPTLQATRSNYRLEHKGKSPLYLEYFIDRSRSRLIVDQLQTEQGGRFLRKRNRNMIVEVAEDIPVYDDFIWLTLGQIKNLMHFDNIINMDARSVISTIPYHKAGDLDEYVGTAAGQSRLDLLMTASLQDSPEDIFSVADQMSWIIDQKLEYMLNVQSIPLNDVSEWIVENGSIHHKSRPFFQVIGVDVIAGNREVGSWQQPMVADFEHGLIGFLVREYDEKYYFLVQAKVEPGNIDTIDLAPTVSCSNYKAYSTGVAAPAFYNNFICAAPSDVLYDHIHSEEGGRFYHLQNRYMIIRDNTIDMNSVPPNFRFMTLGQMLHIAEQGFFNIESRGLFSCVDFLRTN